VPELQYLPFFDEQSRYSIWPWRFETVGDLDGDGKDTNQTTTPASMRQSYLPFCDLMRRTTNLEMWDMAEGS
jgi:hypothetical protein